MTFTVYIHIPFIWLNGLDPRLLPSPETESDIMCMQS